jgi:hypothetical protein
MTDLLTSSYTPAAHDSPKGARLRFYFFSVRLHQLDFRQFLMDALRSKGHDVCHVRIGSLNIVTGVGAKPVEFGGPFGFFELLRFLRKDTASSEDDIVFWDSTGPYTPMRSLMLRACLGAGLWCYDIFDNMNYNYSGFRRLRSNLAISLLSRLSPIQLVLSRETQRLFPKSIHLDNAAHTARIKRTKANYRDLVLLSSVDKRFDADFVRRVAKLAPDRTLFMYGRVVSQDTFRELCRECENIVYRGEFRYDDIDSILAPFGVALAPYPVRHELTEFINPDKYYYFLNSGMEVISTNIPQARRMRDRIHIAGSPEDVLAIMDRLDSDPGFRKNAAGPVFTWQQRATELLEIVSRVSLRHARPDSQSQLGQRVSFRE